jgi:protein-S-isoprenylcysteine O-methyltransferase Ste14
MARTEGGSVSQERKTAEGTPRRGGNKSVVLLFAVATALVLAVCAYFLASMAGWWTGPDWLTIAAAVVLASVIFVGRVFSK